MGKIPLMSNLGTSKKVVCQQNWTFLLPVTSQTDCTWAAQPTRAGANENYMPGCIPRHLYRYLHGSIPHVDIKAKITKSESYSSAR